MTEQQPEHQPRERAVPCRMCGLTTERGHVVPKTMTWNLSGLCDEHELGQSTSP